MPTSTPALDRVLAAANSGITLADATREGFPLTFVNTAFERLTGYAAADIVGRSCRVLQGPGTDPAAIAEISAALRDARDCTVVLRNFRRDGTAFENELRLAPVFDEDGAYVQVVGVQNDVTAHVRATRSLQRATRVIAEQDQELAELRVLQEALTPAVGPPRPGLAVATCFLPAEDGVAGDFHLVAPGPQESTVIVVGDVIGHGLEAARRATFVRTVLAACARFSDDPARLLGLANHALVEREGPSADFVTAVCAVFRPDEGCVHWASAGHVPPVELGSATERTEPGGPPLGLDQELDLPVHTLRLPPGAGLLLCTDGLPEARTADRGPRRERFGDDRVAATVRALADAPVEVVVAELRDRAARHAGGRFADDLCIVALRAT